MCELLWKSETSIFLKNTVNLKFTRKVCIYLDKNPNELYSKENQGWKSQIRIDLDLLNLIIKIALLLHYSAVDMLKNRNLWYRALWKEAQLVCETFGSGNVVRFECCCSSEYGRKMMIWKKFTKCYVFFGKGRWHSQRWSLSRDCMKADCITWTWSQ